jgi:hypothetical protein
MGQARCESIQTKLEKIVPKYVAKFILWYNTPEDKRCDFKDLMPYEPSIKNKTLDDAMEWLSREDAQEAQKEYVKHMRTKNMLNVYNAMYEKALQGDVNAAKWLETFSNSNFFEDAQNDIDDFMNEVNIPALKGGK